MFYLYPEPTLAKAVRAYEPPYDDPIAVKAGEVVTPDPKRSEYTDIIGWSWCVAADGRGGWSPDAWFDPGPDGWTARRDFSALELSITPGEQVSVVLGESGFLWCRKVDGQEGWLPDGVLALVE